VHDPFISFGAGQKRYTVQNALEFGRVKKARSVDEVLPLEDWVAKARKRHPRSTIGPAEVIAELARSYRVKGFRVADDFPAALYLKLKKLGLALELADGPLFPERETKTTKEANAIREGNRLSSLGFTGFVGMSSFTKRRSSPQSACSSPSNQPSSPKVAVRMTRS
jgi:Xaa-Pro aminopeptidase